MGFYIEGPKQGKAAYLINRYPGDFEPLLGPPGDVTTLEPDKVLVVAIQNQYFDAVGIVYDNQELGRMGFQEPGDPRPKHWLLANRERVRELVPHWAAVEGKERL